MPYGPASPGLSSEPQPASPALGAAGPGTPGMSGREGVWVALAKEMGETWPDSHSPPPAAPPPRSCLIPARPAVGPPFQSPSLSPGCSGCCCSVGLWAVGRTRQVSQGHGDGGVGEAWGWHGGNIRLTGMEEQRVMSSVSHSPARLHHAATDPRLQRQLCLLGECQPGRAAQPSPGGA